MSDGSKNCLVVNSDSEIAEHRTVDILGNGQLSKTVIRTGHGINTRPKHGDVVTISYKGWLEDGTLVDDCEEATFVLGDGDILHAFDIALPLAELNEEFELTTVARFAHGSHGRQPDIPPEVSIRYVVHLLRCDGPPDYAAMLLGQRVLKADQKRERGNYHYRRQDYTFALNSYTKALNILTTQSDLPMSTNCRGDEFNDNRMLSETELEQLRLKLHNNLAATQLKLEAYDAAIKSCDTVLMANPENVKALFRKGKALLGLGDTEAAIPVLNRVLEFMPDSRMVLNELSRAHSIRQKELKMWSTAARRLYPKATPSRTGLFKTIRLRSLLHLHRGLILGAILTVMLSALVAAVAFMH